MHREVDRNAIICRDYNSYRDAVGHHALLCRNPVFSTQSNHMQVNLACKRCGHVIEYRYHLEYPEAHDGDKQRILDFIQRYMRKPDTEADKRWTP